MHLSIVTTSTLIKIFSIEKKKIIYMIFITGGVAEWLNAPVLKTDVGESLPWVRIPPPPPSFINNYIYYAVLVEKTY